MLTAHTICWLLASLFCFRMMDKYSSHCSLSTTTCFLASSSSTDMASTFCLVSLIFKRPLRSLLTCSPSSLRFAANSLDRHKHFCKQEVTSWFKQQRQTFNERNRQIKLVNHWERLVEKSQTGGSSKCSQTQTLQYCSTHYNWSTGRCKAGTG